MAKKDYYDILGVKKTDSSETIKKSYKNLALKFHPDKASPDKKKEYEEKFKEINEAYSTLGDEEKKKSYDSGETKQQFTQNSNFGGENLSDIFRDLFRNGSFGSQFGDEDQDIGQNLQYEITISFEEGTRTTAAKSSPKRVLPWSRRTPLW